MLVMPSLQSVFMFEPSGEWIVEGCPEAYRNADNLVLQGFRTLCREAGAEASTVRLTINAGVPVARGLGSSSTCIAAGAAAANAFLGNPFTKDDLFQTCARFESHPDNAAPCVLGGLTASFAASERFHALPLPISPDWRFATVIPNYEVKTSEARKAMPKEISVKDSVFTTSHAIAMINALASGAAAFFISGSGSTLIAMTKSDETALRFTAARDRFPRFDAHVLETCREGVEVKVEQPSDLFREERSNNRSSAPQNEGRRESSDGALTFARRTVAPNLRRPDPRRRPCAPFPTNPSNRRIYTYH